MARLATAAVAGFIGSIAFAGAALAVDSSKCPPITHMEITHVVGANYKLQISATNTCPCRLVFTACSHDKPYPRCETIRIGSRETRKVYVTTPASDGKADYKWYCPD